MDVDGKPGITLRLLFEEGFFFKKTSSEVILNMCFFSWLLPWIDTSSSSMDHII
jgi:hypothetical protein